MLIPLNHIDIERLLNGDILYKGDAVIKSTKRLRKAARGILQDPKNKVTGSTIFADNEIGPCKWELASFKK